MRIIDIIVFIMGFLNIALAIKVKCSDTMAILIFIKLYPLFGGLFVLFFASFNDGVVLLNF